MRIGRARGDGGPRRRGVRRGSVAASLVAAAVLLGGLGGVARAQEGLEQSLPEADLDGDGKLDRSEAPLAVLQSFDEIDGDGDGYIDDFEAYRWDHRRLTESRRRSLAAPRPAEGPDPTGRSTKDLIPQLDRDGDDRVSRDELPPEQRYAFDRLDVDGNGYFDRADAAELDRRMALRREGIPSAGADAAGPGGGGAGGGGRSLARVVQLMDTDGDGLLQKREAPLRLQQMFERFDLNGDGAIDMSEATRAPKPEGGPGDR